MSYLATGASGAGVYTSLFIRQRKEAKDLLRLGVATDVQQGNAIIPIVSKKYARRISDMWLDEPTFWKTAFLPGGPLTGPTRSIARGRVSKAKDDLERVVGAAGEKLTGEQSVYFWRAIGELATTLDSIDATPSRLDVSYTAIRDSLRELPDRLSYVPSTVKWGVVGLGIYFGVQLVKAYREKK